jgi:DNA-binding NarL/FixJ family response regulator
VLVFSTHDESLYADRVLRAGAKGYIMQQEAPEEALAAIRHIGEGRTTREPQHHAIEWELHEKDAGAR